MAAVHGTAPGANIVYVGARDCATSLDIAFMNTVYNHVADIVTNSWGNNGESIAPGTQEFYDQAMKAGAAQGMTILFSSGDHGDLAALNGVASGSWPATSAWATGVGGTTLAIKGTNGGKAEYGWGNYRAFLDDVTVNSATSVTTSGVATVTNFSYTYDDYSFYAGSGGGISLLETQPAYQADAVPAVLATYAQSRERLHRAAPLCAARESGCGHGRRSVHRLSVRRDLHHRRQSARDAGLQADHPRLRSTAKTRLAAPASLPR